MTSRVEPAAAQDGPAEPPAPLVFGYVSLRHAVRAIGRSALAYSNIRRLWWRLAYLDLPLLWLFHALSIARRPNQLVTLGTAGAQLARDDGIAGERPPRTARLLWLFLAVDAVVLIGVPVVLPSVSNTWATLIVSTLWLLILVVVPMFTYGFRSALQQFLGRGVSDWRTATTAETGRAPVFASQVAAWPCKGGGQEGNGDGFELVRELARVVRADGQIMIGVARSKELARKYEEKTHAEPAMPPAGNPRHLRWP